MQVYSSCLRFAGGALLLDTPCGEAPGEILVNDEPVRAAWSPDAAGNPSCRHGDWQLTLREGPAGAFFLDVLNAGSEARTLRAVHLARWSPSAFPHPLETRDFREFIHGPSFQGINAGAKPVGRKTPWLDFVMPSNMLIVYQKEGGEALLLGVVPPMGPAFSEFVTLHSEPHLEAQFGFEARFRFECRVDPGESVRTSPLLALKGSRGTDLMQEYGRRWHELLERKPTRAPLVGWNSWDFYSGAVTRQAMDETLDAARERFGDTLKAFVIDEGWERQWGSWEANGKFPEGLADFCRHVKSRGGVPGIWTAPLLVNIYNPLYLEKPEWFAERADGQVQTDSYSYGPMAYLDPTVPEVIEHLKGIFRRLRADGFEVFKVDFSHCILNAVRFRDARVGRADLIRRAFTAIRDAIGPEAYLLSCGSPYESVVGLADAVRTTGDIHIYWGHILRNAHGISGRWWMQGNLWNGDPDFLVVRGPDTAAPPYGRRRVVVPTGLDGGWMSGVEFSEMEARTYALLVHLSGGDVILGDALHKLNDTGLAIVKRVLEPRRPAAVPVDLFESEQEIPRIWISRGEKDTLVGLFNWSDKPAFLDFDPAAHGLAGTPRDFWTNEPVTALPARMPRRSSLGLRFSS